MGPSACAIDSDQISTGPRPVPYPLSPDLFSDSRARRHNNRGLIHGSGTLWGIAKRVRKQFSGVDIIIFGHSHEPYNHYIQEVLLVNPGQARKSFGLLTIDDGIRADILIA